VSIHLKRWAKLYTDMTPAEKALEPAVASLGIRYRVQHPVWHLGYFPDFALLDDKVVIEVDDPGHARAAKVKRDAERTAKLEAAGWRVLRLTNAEALANPYRAVNRLMKSARLPYRTKKEN
jgi:very-short-patch-repair endonuclease